MQPQPIRVLLVDDDQGDYEMIRVMLGQTEHTEFRLDWVATYEEALDLFAKDEHDVYLLDYFLEDRTGMDLLREAVAQPVSGPVIMLTGRGNPSVDREAMKAGAADYLVKGKIDPDVLERSIRHALERSQAQKALRASEEGHRGMFEHLPIGLYRSAPDGSLIDANPALVRILGYPDRETLRSRYSADLYVHPDDRERFWNLLERYGIVRGFETTVRRLDGTPIRVRNTARLHRGTDGEVLYLEGTLEDVSEERSEEETREGEARFRAVFRSTRSGIALLDLDGLLLEVNPPFASLFRSTPKEMAGASFVGLLDPEDQAPALRELGSLTRGERNHFEAERRYRGPEGELFWARTAMTLVRNAADRPDHVVAVLDGREGPVPRRGIGG